MSKIGSKSYRSTAGNIAVFMFLLVIALFMVLPMIFVTQMLVP